MLHNSSIYYLLKGSVIVEVIVGEGIVVEQVDKDFMVIYKSNGDVGVWKSLDRHRPVVNTDELVDI